MDDTITAAALATRLRRGAAGTIIDVRDRDAFERWHVDGPGVSVVQVPYNRFLAAGATDGVGPLVAEHDDPFIVVCAEGRSSDEVAAMLHEAGHDAANLDGGMEAWAQVAEVLPVTAHDGPGTVVQFHRPATGCCSSLVVVDGEAAVVDPLQAFTDRYVAAAADHDADIVAAVNTHVHADHVSGVRTLAEATGARRVLPVGATDRGLSFDAELVSAGGEVPVGDESLHAVGLSGHTTEMTGFALVDTLLAGDSLFLSAVARPDLERGAAGAVDLAGALYESLQTLREWPADTLVAPGHASPADYPTVAADAPFVARRGDLWERLDVLALDREAFVERVTTAMGPQPANYERLIAINLGRESVDAATAETLELGPNNCAAGG
jgi:glyoxylase-like metal-dependent hydrolase (beta-lactamase superfamily II)/rhodanese-related sulfurtransferase